MRALRSALAPLPAPLVTALLLLALGCASALTVGQILDRTHQRFASLDDRMNRAYQAQAITPADFQDWARFSQSFNARWQRAHKMWLDGTEGPLGVRRILDELEAEIELYLLKLAKRGG
jgi:hypothetical protein